MAYNRPETRLPFLVPQVLGECATMLGQIGAFLLASSFVVLVFN